MLGYYEIVCIRCAFEHLTSSEVASSGAGQHNFPSFIPTDERYSMACLFSIPRVDTKPTVKGGAVQSGGGSSKLLIIQGTSLVNALLRY